MGWIIGLVICLIALTVISGCLVAKSPYDREMDDLEQMEYLREWNKKHSKPLRE